MFHRPTTLNTALLSILWATCALGASTDVNLNDPFEVNKLIGRGVNIGNALDREVELDDEWSYIVKDEHFQAIKDAGFNSVRLTVRWSTRTMDNPPYTIDPNFLKRVDQAVNSALSRNLAVVINYQNYFEFYRDANGLKPKFFATWQQLAEHYKGYPNTLLFELLNEPQGQIGTGEWNTLIKETLAIVRRTNPNRMVVIGPANFNGIAGLRFLELPESDKNLILTIHYYEPYRFTHQGTRWTADSNDWIGTKWTGSEAEKKAIKKDFNAVAGWAKARNRPVYLGEFGSYEKADMDSRALWTKCVADEAVAHGFSFTYWQFTYNMALYDRNSKTWIKPLLDAVIPPKKQ
ncbi:MAG: glycoside hydrolase family 5 protein [Sedimentisphaerales bacterium]|jgi:endoglucanase